MPVAADAAVGLTKVRNLNRNAYRRAQRACRFMSVGVWAVSSPELIRRGTEEELEVSGQTANTNPDVSDLSGMFLLVGKILWTDAIL